MDKKIYVNEKISLKRYNLTRCKPRNVFVCIGPTGSGKTRLGKDICWHLRKKIPTGIVFSETDESNRDYRGIFPATFIHEGFKPKILANLIEQRKTIFSYFEHRNREVIHKYNLKKDVLVIADDCMSDKKWTKDEAVRSMFFQGRHFGITFLFMMQYPLSIQPDERGQLKYIFLFPANGDVGTTDRYFSHYCQDIITDKKIFKAIMDVIALEPGACLVVDRTVHARHWRDKIFWYSPNEEHLGMSPFGCELSWDFHARKYCRNYRFRKIRNPKAILPKPEFEVILEGEKNKSTTETNT